MCWVLPEWREPSRTMSFVVLGHQRHAPQDEGAHEDLAQLRVALHERAQVVPIDGDDRAVGGGARAHQAAPRREHVDLAGELGVRWIVTGSSRSPIGRTMSIAPESTTKKRVF